MALSDDEECAFLDLVATGLREEDYLILIALDSLFLHPPGDDLSGGEKATLRELELSFHQDDTRQLAANAEAATRRLDGLELDGKTLWPKTSQAPSIEEVCAQSQRIVEDQTGNIKTFLIVCAILLVVILGSTFRTTIWHSMLDTLATSAIGWRAFCHDVAQLWRHHS